MSDVQPDTQRFVMDEKHNIEILGVVSHSLCLTLSKPNFAGWRELGSDLFLQCHAVKQVYRVVAEDRGYVRGHLIASMSAAITALEMHGWEEDAW